MGTWWLMLALAVAAFVAGALLIVGPFQGTRTWVQAMGIALLSQGVLSFYVALCAIRIPPRQPLDVAA